MKTVRRFSNIAEAGFACSLLEGAGVEATLADDLAYALGPQYVPWGIRLQVPDSDVQRAIRMLERKEEFAELRDDFVLPPTPAEDDSLKARVRRDFARTFFLGGVSGWAVAGALALMFSSRPEMFQIDDEGALLSFVFIVGGLSGVMIRIIA